MIYDADDALKFLVKKLKHPTADKSYLNKKYDSLEAWSSETREWVKELLRYSPEKVPFETVVTEEEDFGSYTRKKIYFYSTSDCRVSAYLLVPKGLDKPAPAIVALHDHSGRFYWGKEKLVDHKEKLPLVHWLQKYRYGSRGFASVLADKGYVVMIIDSIGFGERGWLNESWIGPDYDDSILFKTDAVSEQYIQDYDKQVKAAFPKFLETINYAGTTYMGMMVWDDIRTVDFLCTLPEVDASRLGCVGLSLGGYRSVWLGAMDERIKCCCAAGYMTKFNDIAPHRAPLGWAVPGLYDRLPYPDLASLVAPRKFLVLNCENDKLFDLSSMNDAVATISKAYDKAGVENSFDAKGFPVGHQFGLEMQEYAFKWFDRHL